ncbi:hypothetical protein KXX48_003115 [Aspergillus fumigatus]|nr:hypothetical protein KXX48_003115 [Aspergillus fumigatus]
MSTTATTTVTATTLVGMLPTMTSATSNILGKSCPTCGQDGYMSQDQLAESARKRVKELEGQVELLNAHATQMAAQLAEYEKEVRRLRSQTNTHTPRTGSASSTLSTPSNESEHSRSSPPQAQQQSRLSTLTSLLPYRRPSTASPTQTMAQPAQPVPSPDQVTTELQTALEREQSLRKAAESQLTQASSELEELTAQLFSIFAREEHLPAVQAAKDFQLKAVYSRSLKSAQDLASGTTGVDLYSEDSGPGKGYADLLARDDIAAVVIALPILVQPDFIRKALTAGKHVLSEKPIAKDIATARDLVQWYHANIDTRKTLWAVAENFRYMTKFLRTAEEVQKLGRVKNFRVNFHALVSTDSKYFKTAWRQTPGYQGGFILDGGVHVVAALRLILGSNDPVATISAQSCLQQQHLPPLDTVNAVMKTKSGATGVLSLSFGSAFDDSVFEFDCEGGVVALNSDTLTIKGESNELAFDGRGVSREVAVFATTIASGGSVDKRQSPEEALADLEIMEKMLTSGERDGERQTVELQVRSLGRPNLSGIFEIELESSRQLSSASQRDPTIPTSFKMVLAKKHVPIVKKRTKRFFRHQSDRFKCVPESWRKPKGIDNRVRRRFKGNIPMPSIGYGSNKKTKHMMPSGHKAFLVHNPKDVELLLMHNRTYAAEIASAVSSRKRVEIIAKAKALGVKVTNPKGRVTVEA